jgi:hypothetical protein
MGSGILTLIFGWERAKGVTDRLENDQNEDFFSRSRDQWNNNQGRLLGEKLSSDGIQDSDVLALRDACYAGTRPGGRLSFSE